MEKRKWDIFINSIFFVLGFSVIFSLLGVLLQSIFSGISYEIQIWLGRIGGIIIIFVSSFTKFPEFKNLIRSYVKSSASTGI